MNQVQITHLLPPYQKDLFFVYSTSRKDGRKVDRHGLDKDDWLHLHASCHEWHCQLFFWLHRFLFGQQLLMVRRRASTWENHKKFPSVEDRRACFDMGVRASTGHVGSGRTHNWSCNEHVHALLFCRESSRDLLREKQPEKHPWPIEVARVPLHAGAFLLSLPCPLTRATTHQQQT